MSTPKRPTNFPPKGSLSGKVGYFTGSPSGPEPCNSSDHHIPTPPTISGSDSDQEPLFEAFGEIIPGNPQLIPFSGAPFSESVAPVPLRYGMVKYDYDESSEDSDDTVTSTLHPLAPLLICSSYETSSFNSSNNSSKSSDSSRYSPSPVWA
jgi:hypothetical protein